MKKILVLLFIGFSTHLAHAQNVLINVSNSMLTSTSTAAGYIDLGTFDPFDPEFNCNSFTSPNTCSANGRDPVSVTLSFDYDIEINSGSSGIDLNFSADNGLGGSVGSFTNLSLPSGLYNLQNTATGSFDVSFDIPLFGPQSQYQYGMDIVIDVTVNP